MSNGPINKINKKTEKKKTYKSKENQDIFSIKQSDNKMHIFENIIGYPDIKKIFQMSLSTEKPVHILLVGPPACAKTLFMLNCIKLERSFFTLGSHSSKAGMLDYLFEKRPRYLIIDEIEHMQIKDQTILLSLMETGIITETKFQKTRSTQIKTWVFATCNNTDKLLTPLLSRFVILKLKKYNFDEFREITIGLLSREEETSIDISETIASAVWYNLKSRDIRDCVKIARLVKNKEDVEFITNTIKKHKITS